MKQPLPQSIVEFQSQYPSVWEAFDKLGQTCHETGGPLDQKTRRLVKLALSIATRHEGAVHSATRQALDAGLTRDELIHTAILAITTIGWPSAHAAMTWIGETIDGQGAGR